VTIFNDTNRGRVSKIQEILNLLDKSAKSNKATSDEVWQLLEPVINQMSDILGAKAEAPAAPVTDADRYNSPNADCLNGLHQNEGDDVCVRCGKDLNEASTDLHTYTTAGREPLGITIKRMAEEAPLKDLTYAMAIYLNRLVEELY
jgi:hypothetical protein